ncbi:hypothetical protein SO078_01960 [Sinorhizobium meliloti]|uniref:hypothetical protein n=1 Tax=Rhizobium meliloti TaxID=382 RepID=UPI002D779703|nr:hypothetical protein [Sinorhizobium meliloti]WRQ68011.1 hypothetical protein SO078_01960 [Sinorhizobium meliloti]
MTAAATLVGLSAQRRCGNLSEDCNLSSSSFLCLSQESSQTKSLGWKGSSAPQTRRCFHLCDEHRNEEIKPAAAGDPNLNRPYSIYRIDASCFPEIDTDFRADAVNYDIRPNRLREEEALPPLAPDSANASCIARWRFR